MSRINTVPEYLLYVNVIHVSFQPLGRPGRRWEDNIKMDFTLEGPCIILCNIYTFQRDTQCSCTD